MLKWIYLGAGGILGTFSRYILGNIVQKTVENNFAYSTLCVNIIGCFIIGLFASLLEGKYIIPKEIQVFVMAGFCGAFTTFSAFILETNNFIKGGEFLFAILNIVLSIIICLLFFRAGFLIGKFV
jgi:fluoride exporter